MLYRKGQLVFCSFLIVLVSCNPYPKGEQEATSESRSFSTSFKPMVFLEDNRNEKIKSIASDFDHLIEEHAKNKHIPGIAYGIVVDNDLIVSGATGFINIEDSLIATPRSCFRIASMTKSFTAMAILMLRDDGKLSLDDPVEKYIPEMHDLEYLTRDAPVITIENLLTMTAGFPEDNPWGDRQLEETDQMLMDLIADGLSFSNPSSYQFEYSNTGYALLGNIITRVANTPYQDYIQEKILHPLEMYQTYWEYDSVPEEQLALGYRWEDEQWKLEPMLHDGSYGAMGGLITTIEDFAKYVSFHLSAWPPRNDPDHGPVRRSTLREMQTIRNPSLYASARDLNGDPCALIYGYGFGLGVNEDCHGFKTVNHGGALPGFGGGYDFYPDYGVGIMAFCNLTYTAPIPRREAYRILLESTEIEPRQLPASDILLKKQEQVTALIQNWDKGLEMEILAENFYLDKSRERRISDISEMLNKAGVIDSTGELQPENQLRGSYKLHAEHGDIGIYFTLTPEKRPKVQQLEVTFDPSEN